VLDLERAPRDLDRERHDLAPARRRPHPELARETVELPAVASAGDRAAEQHPQDPAGEQPEPRLHPQGHAPELGVGLLEDRRVHAGS
jgi:hypothetical protein